MLMSNGIRVLKAAATVATNDNVASLLGHSIGAGPPPSTHSVVHRTRAETVVPALSWQW